MASDQAPPETVGSPADPSPRARSLRRLLSVAAGVLLIASALTWAIVFKHGAIDLPGIAHHLRAISTAPLAPLYCVAAVIVGAIAGLPFTSMAAVCMLVFGIIPGAAYMFVGALLGGSVLYLIGRFAARDAVSRWLARRSDPRFERFNARLGRHGFVPVMLLRLTPLPFVVQTVLLGASRVRYVDFLGGTAVGIVPVLALIASLTEGIDAWVEGEHLSTAAVIACVVLAVGVILLIHLGRRKRAALAAHDQ